MMVECTYIEKEAVNAKLIKVKCLLITGSPTYTNRPTNLCEYPQIIFKNY